MKTKGNLKAVERTSQEEIRADIEDKLNRVLALLRTIKARSEDIQGEGDWQVQLEAVGDIYVLAEMGIPEVKEAFDKVDFLKVAGD